MGGTGVKERGGEIIMPEREIIIKLTKEEVYHLLDTGQHGNPFLWTCGRTLCGICPKIDTKLKRAIEKIEKMTKKGTKKLL